MELVKPASFFVVKDGEKKSLLNKLKETKVMDKKAWKTEFAVKRPGVYSFCMIPRPYWEPAEDCYIVHYTRTVVAAFGDDEGWDAELEVEYYNEDGKAKAPADYMVTQTIKADKNGVFSYAVPKSGWWGFAALNTSDKKMKYKEEEKDIEMGAVLWVKFEDF